MVKINEMIDKDILKSSCALGINQTISNKRGSRNNEPRNVFSGSISFL